MPSTLLTGLMLLASCASGPRAVRDPAGEANGPPIPDVILVDRGDNADPSLSPRGDRLLFVSRQRPAHKGAEIYEVVLKSGVERRITYQNGDAANPRYINAETIVYGSSTDEQKETFGFLAPPANTKLPAPYGTFDDVYVRPLVGDLEIARLSHHPGYDGEARLQADGRTLTWTLVDQDQTKIETKTWPNGAVRPVKNLGINPTQYVLGPDGQSAAWIGWDRGFAYSHLKLREGTETVEIGAETTLRKSDPSFTPDGKYLVWAQADPSTKRSTIWSYERRTGCTQTFEFLDKAERSDPVVTNDGWVIFRRQVKNGPGQLAKVPFHQRLGECPQIP